MSPAVDKTLCCHLMLPSDVEALVTAIHAAPEKVVIEFAGAGALALAWLHSLGGSSRTILEATDRYTPASLAQSVGFRPEQFTSPPVAGALATQAYIRACELAEDSISVAGIGCTATIATDRQKRGEHRCFVAMCNAQGVTGYSLKLEKGLRDRLAEEELVSRLILRAIAEACHIAAIPPLPLSSQDVLNQQHAAADLLSRLLAGDFPLVVVQPDGRLFPAHGLPNANIYSGAFNPLHNGHRQLARVAEIRLGRPVYFELPLVNADKPPLEVGEAQRRIAQFANYAPLILTTAPLFSQKARLFPHSTFILGVDTVERLVQPRFYQNDPARMLASFQEIRKAGCQFLVAGRQQAASFLTVSDISLPQGYQELFIEIPENDFRVDLSSTDLRNDTS